jgi:NAD-dependent deacetylase
LHRRAGSKNLIELHGNIFRNKCFKEGIPVEGVETFCDLPPRCPECGGFVRPDVVWFGENLSPGVLDSALRAAQTAEVFLSVGTSSGVQPAASLPLLALERGAMIIEINPDDTLLTPQTHFSVRAASGKVLPQLIKTIWN